MLTIIHFNDLLGCIVLAVLEHRAHYLEGTFLQSNVATHHSQETAMYLPINDDVESTRYCTLLCTYISTKLMITRQLDTMLQSPLNSSYTEV
jgi:hypothetical protein